MARLNTIKYASIEFTEDEVNILWKILNITPYAEADEYGASEEEAATIPGLYDVLQAAQDLNWEV